MVDRTHRELTNEDIRKITDTYHAWRGDVQPQPTLWQSYQDVPGFCKAVGLEDIRKHGYVLTPGRYVGAAQTEYDDEPFEEKMTRLTTELKEQMQKAAKLDAVIWANLENLGHGR